jgi:D-aminopeptidase
MEGASQLRSVREIWGCLPEYWQTGKPRLEEDVAAVCEGLLAGGASELVVLDNHGGNTVNVSPETLPAGADSRHGVTSISETMASTPPSRWATTRVAASTVSYPTRSCRG